MKVRRLVRHRSGDIATQLLVLPGGVGAPISPGEGQMTEDDLQKQLPATTDFRASTVSSMSGG